jgi:hypothetical protein
LFGPEFKLGSPARKAEGLSSNPGPGKNFSLELTSLFSVYISTGGAEKGKIARKIRNRMEE